MTEPKIKKGDRVIATYQPSPDRLRQEFADHVGWRGEFVCLGWAPAIPAIWEMRAVDAPGGPFSCDARDLQDIEPIAGPA